MYKGKYMTQLEEDGFVKSLNWLVDEKDKASGEMKSLLLSMLGEQYSNYLQRNYYRINNRTETVDFKTDDIRTWTIGQLGDASRDYFLESVKDKSTKDSPIESWKTILTGAKNSDHLRPTLYDFLAHRALDFLMNERNYLTEPVYKFYIDQKEAFAEPLVFANYNFETKDSTSAKYQTILLFQDIIKHNLKREDKAPLLDADLKRLRFVKNNGVLENKDELFLKALEGLNKKYGSLPESTEVLYQIAQHYRSQGGRYTPNPENKGKWSKAMQIFESTTSKEIIASNNGRSSNSKSTNAGNYFS